MGYRIQPVRAVWRTRAVTEPLRGRARSLAQWREYSIMLRMRRMAEEERCSGSGLVQKIPER